MAEIVTKNKIPYSNTSMMPKRVYRVSISKILPLVSLLLVEIVKISIVIATKIIILIILLFQLSHQGAT